MAKKDVKARETREAKLAEETRVESPAKVPESPPGRNAAKGFGTIPHPYTEVDAAAVVEEIGWDQWDALGHGRRRRALREITGKRTGG